MALPRVRVRTRVRVRVRHFEDGQQDTPEYLCVCGVVDMVCQLVRARVRARVKVRARVRARAIIGYRQRQTGGARTYSVRAHHLFIVDGMRSLYGHASEGEGECTAV